MDSLTKFNNMLVCKKPSDRREIPCYPMILTWCGPAAGMTQEEICTSTVKWRRALDKTFEKLGRPDVFVTTAAGDAAFLMALPVKMPGRDLDKNTQYQFLEKPNMTHDDYRAIIKNGWDAWFNSYMMRIQKPPIKSSFNLILRFIRIGGTIGKNVRHFTKMGMVPIYVTAMEPAFDSLFLIRSMEEFILDLYEEGEMIHDVLRRATPEINKLTLTNVKRAKGTRAGCFAMRSSCSFLSPSVFEEYSWPYLKQTIEEFWKAGVTTVLHADGNWLPLLKYFHDVPKYAVHFELDGSTDIFKAHAILDGWQSIRGDVSATMLAFGKTDEVSDYCEKLVTGLGMKGGFMLGSGCEVPLNAKLENVRAMLNAVR